MDFKETIKYTETADGNIIIQFEKNRVYYQILW